MEDRDPGGMLTGQDVRLWQSATRVPWAGPGPRHFLQGLFKPDFDACKCQSHSLLARLPGLGVWGIGEKMGRLFW